MYLVNNLLWCLCCCLKITDNYYKLLIQFECWFASCTCAILWTCYIWNISQFTFLTMSLLFGGQFHVLLGKADRTHDQKILNWWSRIWGIPQHIDEGVHIIVTYLNFLPIWILVDDWANKAMIFSIYTYFLLGYNTNST